MALQNLYANFINRAITFKQGYIEITFKGVAFSPTKELGTWLIQKEANKGKNVNVALGTTRQSPFEAESAIGHT